MWITSRKYTQKVIDKHKQYRATLIPLLNKTKSVHKRNGREEKKGMRSFTISRVFDRHTRAVAAAVGLLLATLAPAVAPVFVSAAQLTDRSLELDSSSAGATGVRYHFKFTAAATAGAAVVQFCSNTPLIGEYCDTPTGFTAAGATNVSGITAISSATASTVKITKSITAAEMEFVLGGITNPSSTGTIYARILTYADASAADTYAVTDSSSTLGSPIDQGSVAIAITSTVAVSGDVLEALTFCVSGSDLTGTDCATGYSAPILTLGKNVGNGVIALDPSELSERDVFTKISTNAIGGAVVSLKSTAGVDDQEDPCAGLALYGTGNCNIAAAGTSGTFAAGTAKFGVKLTLPVDNSTNGTIAVETNYDTSDYRLDGAAAIGTYGDTIYNTSGGSANNLNTKLTFAASSTAATPAGRYSANISLIATGTF